MPLFYSLHWDQTEIGEQTVPALCSPETFAHGQEDPSYGFMESNTAKCASQLLIQRAFRHPSIVEQLSAFINSRNVFIKIHGSALLKLHKSNWNRPPLFIFPGHCLREGYFQYIIQTSPQACSKHCRKYILQSTVFLFCLTSCWRAVFRTHGPKSKKQKWSALTITGTPTPQDHLRVSLSQKPWPQHGRGPPGFSTDRTPRVVF